MMDVSMKDGAVLFKRNRIFYGVVYAVLFLAALGVIGKSAIHGIVLLFLANCFFVGFIGAHYGLIILQEVRGNSERGNETASSDEHQSKNL
jgi:F0F1-type ATP synthase assembly protein I